MSTIPQQIETLRNQITSLRALVNGVNDSGKSYVINGDFCLYGCKINQGTSAADMYLAMAGQATGDEPHRNPNIVIPSLRTEEYANIALVYGTAFLMEDVNVVDTANDSLLLDDAPTTPNYGRYDVIYAYVGQSGPAVAILTGVASAAVKTDFVANGLDVDPYPSTFDSTLPRGTLPLARVYVQTGDTGIADARIVDLRAFEARLNPVANPSSILLTTGGGLGLTNTAARIFTTTVENNCPGITYSTTANAGARFTATIAGDYVFEFCDIGQNTTSYIGLSLNSNQLATSVESVAAANLGARITKSATTTTKHNGHLMAVIRMVVGDFVVPHCTIGTYTGESNLTRLSVRKLLDV